METAVEEFPHIPIVMHQDHGGSPSDCKTCIDLGFSSVMMDGSLLEDQKTPSDFDYNVKVTREAVNLFNAVLERSIATVVDRDSVQYIGTMNE